MPIIPGMSNAPRFVLFLLVQLAALPALARTQSLVQEFEPNNTVQTANAAALGDRVVGVINPSGDRDVWSVDLVAGQFLSLDVDAKVTGSLLDPTITLLAPDGVTLVAFNDDFDGFDSRISFRIRESGRYYFVIRAFGDGGSPGSTYAVAVGTVTCGAVGTEREPNGTAATATPIAIGDAGSGEICAADDNPAGDVDYWAFTAQAGTTIDLDAASLGVFSDPFVALYASDGVTQLASNDDAAGVDSRLQFSFASAGTYYAAVSTIADPGGNSFPYTLHIRAIAGGPGDPITVRGDRLGLPVGIAVGNTGDVFVSDLAGARVVRITTQGVGTTFAAGIQNPQGMAFDAFGNLLVASLLGTVYRVTPQGQATPFITDAEAPVWVAVAPDGRIWLTNLSDRSLRRYSAAGRLELRFDGTTIGGSGPGPVAIGPSGEPYVSNGTQIWKLSDGQFRLVVADEFVLWGFAFDVAGNMYAPAPAAGLIKVFDPAGRPLANPFAVSPDNPQALAFGRDATGATVARLFATDRLVGRVIEFNPAGVAHRGLALGYVAPSFTLETAAASLLGATGLSAADSVYLDALGNHNGRYDVGDFHAFLRALDALSGVGSSRSPSGRER